MEGAALGVVNRSRRVASNTSLSLGSQVTLALAGVNVNVAGEHHLWASRPAVFIFNHQSLLDPLVVFQMVQKDVTAVGKKEVEKLAKRDLAAGRNVVSDGLSCWPAVEKAGCRHFPMATGSGKQAARWAPSRWVNTVLGNIKTAMAGTYHHVSAKHAQRYLASYAWRFNRRFQLDTLTERLAYACARTAPHPYRVIIAG